MNKKLALLLPLFLPTASWAGDIDDNDFGTWLEVGAKKELNHLFSLEAGAELRTQNCSKNVDRLSIGVSGTYKMNKYLKFSLGYAFLDSYKTEKSKIKEGDKDGSGILLDYRERITDSHWSPRHRVYFEVSPDIKIAKVLRISLRERYQYTFTPAQTLDRIANYYEWNGSEYEFDYSENDPKNEKAEHKHVLRSRLKFEYDKKRVDWKPYYSIEFHNNLRNEPAGEKSMYLRKVRNAFGTDYKINRHHSIGLAYILTLEREPNEDVVNDNIKTLMHAVNVSYSYKF